MALHSAWCLIHLALEAVVPLWMLSPASRGGLQFEPVDSALVFAFVGTVRSAPSPTRQTPAKHPPITRQSPTNTHQTHTKHPITIVRYSSF